MMSTERVFDCVEVRLNEAQGGGREEHGRLQYSVRLSRIYASGAEVQVRLRRCIVLADTVFYTITPFKF
jgi:hypothetical protein